MSKPAVWPKWLKQNTIPEALGKTASKMEPINQSCTHNPHSVLSEVARDIIVKLLYYRSKERLLVDARDKHQVLRFQGHDYQLFPDLVLSLIQKLRAMKPFLDILQQHHVEYLWGCPYAVVFFFKGKRYVIKTPGEMDNCLRGLHLFCNQSSGSQQDS